MAAAVRFVKKHGLVITTLRGLGGQEVFEDYIRQVEFLTRGVPVIREFVDLTEFGNFPPQNPDEFRAFMEGTTALINTHESWTTAIFTDSGSRHSGSASSVWPPGSSTSKLVV